MSKIIKWWASNPVAANLLMIACFIGGIFAFFTIERELDPYVEFPGANVSIAWLGASPQDVEEQLIVRMEEALSTVDGVNRMYAFAGEGRRKRLCVRCDIQHGRSRRLPLRSGRLPSRQQQSKTPQGTGASAYLRPFPTWP